MKAKVIKTERIIEVEKGLIGYVECAAANINGFPAQNFYAEDELDFNISAPEKAVIEGYVARDKDGLLGLYSEMPKRDYDDEWYGEYDRGLSSELFPSITWQSEPRKVKIEITLIDEKGE